MNNFNRNNNNNNIFNSPWQNPPNNNIPSINTFFGAQLNGIPPLIQYPNIYQHQHNNFPNHNQNRPDQNRRFKNNFQDFNRNKNRNSFSKSSRWTNNNKNSQNEGTSSGRETHEDPDKIERSDLNESFMKKVENNRSEEPKSEESKSSNLEKPENPSDSLSIDQKATLESSIDRQRSSSIDAICAKSANDVTKKLFSRLRTMDKSNIKDIINNPKLQYETALKVQARQKLNQKMRVQLKLLSEGENRDGPDLEPDLTVDADKIPMSFIEEIGKAFDLNLLNETTAMNVETVNDTDEKAIEVVTNNLGSEDLMFQAERLLMDVNSILDIYDQPEKVDQEIPEPPLINAITHAGDVEMIDKMTENGAFIRNNSKDPPPIIPFEEKPWEPAMSTKEYEGNLKIIHPIEPVVENLEPKPIIQEKPEVVPKRPEREEPQDRDSFSNSNSNHSQPQPMHRSVSPTRRREIDISAGNSMSPNDRFRDARERDGWPRKERDVDYRRSEQDRSRERGRDRDREKERERERDRDKNREKPRPRGKQNQRSLNIWENPPEKFRQESLRPSYPDTSHIQPLMSLNPKPPTPTPIQVISTPILTPTSTPIAVEPAKLTDDVISNVYRTKLNVEPGQEPDLDSILKPRQFQFKGSFRRGPSNKVKDDQRSRFDQFKGRDRSVSPLRRRRSRSRSASRGRGYHNNYRSGTRRSTEPEVPKLNEKDFNVHLGGLKSHVSALKRMAEIDLEISRTIERLQGIDKVIANMQTEKNTAQRAFNKLNMERKHLLESVIKEAQNYVPPAPVIVPPRAVTPTTTTTTPAASPEPDFDKPINNNIIASNSNSSNNTNKSSNSSNNSNKLQQQQQQQQPQQQQQYQQQHIKKSIPVKPPKNIVNVESKKRKLEENIKKEPDDKKRKPETSEVNVSSEHKKSKHGDTERKMKKSHNDKSGRDLERERHKRDESEKSKKMRNEEFIRKEIKKENDTEKPTKKDESGVVTHSESNSSTENKTTTAITSGIPSTVTSSSSASVSSQSVENSAKKHKKKFFDNETDVTDSLARKEKKSKHGGEKPEKKIRKLNEDHLKRALKNAKIQAAKTKQLLFDETSFIKGNYDLKMVKILVNKMVINDDVKAKYKRLGFARMEPEQVITTSVVKKEIIETETDKKTEDEIATKVKVEATEPVAETVSDLIETAMEVDMSGPVESPTGCLVINESDPLDFENAQFEILSEVTEDDPIEATPTENPKATETEVIPEQIVEPVAEDVNLV